MSELFRTFIGIRPPEDIRERIAVAQMSLRRRAGSEVARWTPPHELFLSLCALGELNAGTLFRVGPTVEQVFANHPPLKLEMLGFGGSPNSTQPRIAWIGVGGDTASLEALHADIERAIVPLGLQREITKLACHVPIGKLKYESESGRSDLGRALRMTQVEPLGAWLASDVELMKSDVGPSGPTVVTLASFALRG